jgi:hypothetical protein
MRVTLALDGFPSAVEQFVGSWFHGHSLTRPKVSVTLVLRV